MRRQGLLFVLLAALGLALYLWPAISSPVVLWSDSTTDLEWAKTGLGIFRPVPQPATGALDHQPKPAYLLFLRGVMRASPAEKETRAIVIVQSLLLWGAIVGSSLRLARKSPGKALAFMAIAFTFLRLRDASSAVMPEALAVTLLLPLTAAFLAPPKRVMPFALLGLSTAILFYIRPNCGAAMFLLAIVALTAERRGRSLLAFVAGFVVLVVPFALATRPAPRDDEPFHGLGYQVLEASANYYWRPSLGAWPSGDSPRATALAEIRAARENWSRTLADPGADVRRELLWRGLHGLFGTEFYDARWSEPYRRLWTASRLLSPFLILVSAGLLLAPWLRDERPSRVMGWFLMTLIVGQSLLLGSNPRYALPFLPVLFLLAVTAASPSSLAGTGRKLAAAAVFVVGVVLLAGARQILNWEWGKVETPGVRLIQPIPKGALPSPGPATLHVRVASPLMPPAASFEIFGPGSRLLYSSLDDPLQQRPYVTISLPDWLLEANRSGPTDLTFVSLGGYELHSYLLFPVIPPPWSTRAHRDGSPTLSPSTGISTGSLDWWAHTGTD